MTTATDWDVRDRDTSDRLTVTDVRARIDQLDGAATEAPVQIEPWVARKPDHIHDDLCRRVQPAEYADEPAPHAGPAPGTADLTKRIDLTMASYRLMRHQEVKAELWHAEASHMWAEQGTTSRISEHYTDRREALLSAYERECAAIKAGLTRTSVEYGGHTYDEQRGFVSVAMPESIPHSDTPDRSDVKRMTARVNGGLSALGASQPETPVQTPVAGAEPHKPWWRRNSEWLISGAVFVAWAGAIGLTIWLTGGP